MEARRQQVSTMRLVWCWASGLGGAALSLQQPAILAAGDFDERRIGAIHARRVEDLLLHADLAALFDYDGAPGAGQGQGLRAPLEATDYLLTADREPLHSVGLPDQVGVQHVDVVDALRVARLVREHRSSRLVAQVLEVHPHCIEQTARLRRHLVAGAPVAVLVDLGVFVAHGAHPRLRAEPVDAEVLQERARRVDDALARWGLPNRWHLVTSRPLCPRGRRRRRRRRKRALILDDPPSKAQGRKLAEDC